MSEIALVTDAELTRARHDVAFRHQLVAGTLDGLLSKLNALRNGKVDAEGARQVREGVDLAVQLAELLQRIDSALAETRRAG